jgi:hypothetical protein
VREGGVLHALAHFKTALFGAKGFVDVRGHLGRLAQTRVGGKVGMDEVDGVDLADEMEPGIGGALGRASIDLPFPLGGGSA